MKKYNQNQKLVLAYLRKHGPSTKYDLADYLDISIPTVTTNINKLIREGIIKEIGVAEADFGRKPILLDIAYSSRFSLGLDIEGDTLHYCLMNLKLETVHSGKRTLNNTDLMLQLLEVISFYIDEYCTDSSKLIGIGISCPGLVDTNSLLLNTSLNMKIPPIDLAFLEAQLQIPITIGNKANLAAFSETVIGNSTTLCNCLYISINEGIGCGIIIDKKYYSGSHHLAGEIGHMVIDKSGPLCSCGGHGCIESYLSTHTLIRQFQNIGLAHVHTLSDVFMAYEPTNSLHTQILHNYVESLVVTLNNLFLMFDPDCIIIGGAITLYKDYISNFLYDQLQQSSTSLLSKNRCVKFSNLEGNGSVLGACLVTFQSITSFI